MKKFILNLLFFVYVIIAIGVTACLLAYNDSNVPVFGKYTLINITDEELAPDFEEGELAIVKSVSYKNINVGDKIFFYISDEINYAEVRDIVDYDGKARTFVLDGDYRVEDDQVIGSNSSTTRIKTLGTILSILQGKLGFLFLIVVPSLLAFLYQLLELIVEIKSNSMKVKEEVKE